MKKNSGLRRLKLFQIKLSQNTQPNHQKSSHQMKTSEHNQPNRSRCVYPCICIAEPMTVVSTFKPTSPTHNFDPFHNAHVPLS